MELTEKQTIEILKKKLQSMQYSKADVQDETSRDAKQFMYGYTECINDLLEYLIEGGDGLPEHSLALQEDDNELYYVSKDSDSQDKTDKIIKDLSGEKIPNIKTITSTDYGQEKEQKSFDGMEYHNTCSFD